MKHYRTAWISDVHLGTRGSQAEALLDFLRDHEFETLSALVEDFDGKIALLTHRASGPASPEFAEEAGETVASVSATTTETNSVVVRV